MKRLKSILRKEKAVKQIRMETHVTHSGASYLYDVIRAKQKKQQRVVIIVAASVAAIVAALLAIVLF